MILGTGIDIVEIQRIEKLIKKDDAFKLKVFSEEEIIFCEKRSAESYAGRFAAKEAFMKALGVGWTSNSEFKEISVRADKLGKPYLHLSGKTAESIEDGVRFHLSISHSKNYAIAFVIMEQNIKR